MKLLQHDIHGIVYTPQKFNTEPEKRCFSKRNLLFQGLMFRFHVKLQGCDFLPKLVDSPDCGEMGWNSDLQLQDTWPSIPRLTSITLAAYEGFGIENSWSARSLRTNHISEDEVKSTKLSQYKLDHATSAHVYRLGCMTHDFHAFTIKSTPKWKNTQAYKTHSVLRFSTFQLFAKQMDTGFRFLLCMSSSAWLRFLECWDLSSTSKQNLDTCTSTRKTTWNMSI